MNTFGIMEKILEIKKTDPEITVNTLPVLTDNAVVSGDNMPYSTRTVTITYTDADGHAGVSFSRSL